MNLEMRNMSMLHITYDGKTVDFKYDDTIYESRGTSVSKMINEAINLCSDTLKPFNCSFYLGDTKSIHSKYSFSDSVYHDGLIPCFAFDCWKEVGIEDYDTICNSISNIGDNPIQHNNLFWIGNVNTHITRRTLCHISTKDPRIAAFDCGSWDEPIGYDAKNPTKKIPRRYVSIPDHAKFKYLIDLQGGGWSARTKMLMFSKRPLFIQDRNYKEYWFFDLKPFVHYIPVNSDLSNLSNMLDWAEANPVQCREIAMNAFQFADANLRRKNAVEKYAEILRRYSNV